MLAEKTELANREIPDLGVLSLEDSEANIGPVILEQIEKGVFS
jgi:hypothetical protein